MRYRANCHAPLSLPHVWTPRVGWAVVPSRIGVVYFGGRKPATGAATGGAPRSGRAQQLVDGSGTAAGRSEVSRSSQLRGSARTRTPPRPARCAGRLRRAARSSPRPRWPGHVGRGAVDPSHVVDSLRARPVPENRDRPGGHALRGRDVEALVVARGQHESDSAQPGGHVRARFIEDDRPAQQRRTLDPAQRRGVMRAFLRLPPAPTSDPRASRT